MNAKLLSKLQMLTTKCHTPYRFEMGKVLYNLETTFQGIVDISFKQIVK